ncbi:hypothetical protein EGR_08996 [Echinococcus granulosus]|uniref:Uncharacterized protein n=1 Tax=Echinococcus granulosus TaxID=6210 RepID=W6U6Z1_ECHGR|nr:hypothetical protein EGR_08996 [Echinococcus granulosus]EUB56146.1 hypothetical protein EGR_08996 [Echinococcus granulosus]
MRPRKKVHQKGKVARFIFDMSKFQLFRYTYSLVMSSLRHQIHRLQGIPSKVLNSCWLNLCICIWKQVHCSKLSTQKLQHIILCPDRWVNHHHSPTFFSTKAFGSIRKKSNFKDFYLSKLMSLKGTFEQAIQIVMNNSTEIGCFFAKTYFSVDTYISLIIKDDLFIDNLGWI